MRHARVAVLATAAVSAAVTLVITVLPQLHYAYRAPHTHVALETAATLIGLLASFLVFGRLRRRPLLNELLLACGLGLLALTNLSFVIVPTLAESSPHRWTVWAAIVGRSLGALLFALAAFVPRRRLRRPTLMLAAGVAGI